MIGYASPLSQYLSHKGAIDAAVARVLMGGSYILNEDVAAFETAFARYCGAAHAVSVASGTDALTLALMACGIGQGDEVITASHTAVATVAAILAARATPVLADVDPRYYTLAPDSVEASITPRTKAILPVHLYGQAADLGAIGKSAARHGLAVIEDCAQASGAEWRTRKVGSFGRAGCFSFFPTKNLGAIGDGGMIVTSDAELAARLRRLRQYGWDDAREPREIGVNSRLDALQAAILAAKLPCLDTDNARREAVAARYDAALAGLPLMLPQRHGEGRHVFHLYVVACDDRDALRAALATSGIQTGIHYEHAVHQQPCYARACRLSAGGFAATERLTGRILSLPLYPELAPADQDRVIAAIRSHYQAP